MVTAPLTDQRFERVRQHDALLDWVAPVGLRPANGLGVPQLLAIESDLEMANLGSTLATPVELTGRRAVKRSHSRSDEVKKDLKMLTLYQPVHGYFPLVSSELVCRRIGTPDHLVDPATDEVGFVLRRNPGAEELAWVPSTSAASSGSWVRLGEETVLSDEELHTATPLALNDSGTRRTIYVGLVPSSRADLYGVPETEYVVRMVYRRPACNGLHRDVVSEPTEAFHLAGYWSVHAPARDLQLRLPDMANAGAYAATIKAVMPDGLRDKVNTAIRAVAPKLGSTAGVDHLGACAFSLPIITIIAMVLMMIMFLPLSIAFFWSGATFDTCLASMKAPEEPTP